jgi:hypothetical protein
MKKNCSINPTIFNTLFADILSTKAGWDFSIPLSEELGGLLHLEVILCKVRKDQIHVI